jgi:hypothetical protein
MDSDDSTTKKINNGFVNHVFNFDNDTKCELMNLLQYVVLAIIPISLYNYVVDSVIPEVDESKSNLEILAEIVGQLSLLVVGLFFIDRLITYVPTYSGRAFGNMNLFSVLLVMLVMAYESHTKVGEKSKILLNRLKELWEGKKDGEKDGKKDKKDVSVVKVTQPISRAGMPTHQPSRADYLNSHNQMVSPTQMMPPAEEVQTDNGASNQMYNSGGFGGLQGANQVGASEPMAANEGFGAFSSF